MNEKRITISQEDIVNRTYSYLLEMVPRLEKLPRTQKFLIADRIEIILLDILDTFVHGKLCS